MDVWWFPSVIFTLLHDPLFVITIRHSPSLGILHHPPSTVIHDPGSPTTLHPPPTSIEHGSSWYNCNRFDEKASKDARDSQAKSRQQLERYLHYFNRYANHEQSAKLANEFYNRTEKKMEEMQLTSDFSWIEVQFMKKALEVVLDCRVTLKWTYALAYYLERGNMTTIFEDNQRDLEMAVENLNELIERPVPVSDLGVCCPWFIGIFSCLCCFLSVLLFVGVASCRCCCGSSMSLLAMSQLFIPDPRVILSTSFNP